MIQDSELKALTDAWGTRISLNDLILTEAADALPDDARHACHVAEMLGVTYVPRKKRSLSRMFFEQQITYIVVEHRSKALSLHKSDDSNNKFIYHPGISLLRAKAMQRGEQDKLLNLAQVEPGDIILDGTAGLCSDALMFSFAVGERGLCIALEASPYVAFIVAHGLQTYDTSLPDLQDAMRRLRLVCDRSQDVFEKLPDRSVDIVYLDPMFEHAIKRSAAMASLRPFSVAKNWTVGDILQARRIARKAVVIKARRHTDWLRILPGFDLAPGRGSTTYAVAIST